MACPEADEDVLTTRHPFSCLGVMSVVELRGHLPTLSFYVHCSNV